MYPLYPVFEGRFKDGDKLNQLRNRHAIRLMLAKALNSAIHNGLVIFENFGNEAEPRSFVRL